MQLIFFWSFLWQKGTKAPQAAGKIHTDFEKGFIMAEVMKYEDFKEGGSEAAVKVSSPLFLLLPDVPFFRLESDFSLEKSC